MTDTNIKNTPPIEKHVSIDIETLGTNALSPVVQIGLVFFTTQGITVQSQLTIDFDDALRYGKADGHTIKWWLERPKEAQNTLFQNQIPLTEAADIFEKLIAAQNPNYFWAHATFDFPIINSMFTALGRKTPLPYRRCFDLRTLDYIAGPVEQEPRTGVYHNALDDASYQAKHIIQLLKKLGR